MAAPANVDLTVVAGDDETVEVTLTSDSAGTPVNITGRTYALQVRSNDALDAATTAACVFTCSVPSGTDGKVVCTAAGTETDNLEPGNSVGYTYDLVETVGSTTSTLMRGRVHVIQKVTK